MDPLNKCSRCIKLNRDCLSIFYSQSQQQLLFGGCLCLAQLMISGCEGFVYEGHMLRKHYSQHGSSDESRDVMH